LHHSQITADFYRSTNQKQSKKENKKKKECNFNNCIQFKSMLKLQLLRILDLKEQQQDTSSSYQTPKGR